MKFAPVSPRPQNNDLAGKWLKRRHGNGVEEEFRAAAKKTGQGDSAYQPSARLKLAFSGPAHSTRAKLRESQKPPELKPGTRQILHYLEAARREHNRFCIKPARRQGFQDGFSYFKRSDLTAKIKKCAMKGGTLLRSKDRDITPKDLDEAYWNPPDGDISQKGEYFGYKVHQKLFGCDPVFSTHEPPRQDFNDGLEGPDRD